MMSSAYKLIKRVTIYSLDVVLSLFGTSRCSMSSSNCCFLTYIDFSRGRSGGLVFPSLEEFSTVCCDPHSQRLWHSQWSRSRCFSGIILLFLWSSGCDNLICGSSAFSKSSLNIWKFTVHVLLKPDLENFEHYFASVWDECNCAVVWALFGIAFLWVWNEPWSFPVPLPLLSFPILLAYWGQRFHSIIF